MLILTLMPSAESTLRRQFRVLQFRLALAIFIIPDDLQTVTLANWQEARTWLNHVLDDFRRWGYTARARVICPSRFGASNRRRRTYLVGSWAGELPVDRIILDALPADAFLVDTGVILPG